MQRTKQAPRKGQPNKRIRANTDEKASRNTSPPSKKTKKNPPSNTTSPTTEQAQAQPPSPTAPTTNQSNNNAAADTSASATPLTAPDLSTTHDVMSMRIISSSHIQQKVSRVLELLSVKQKEKGKERPSVVMLHAKAACACKMISIAEIAKREVGKEGGKWFEYCVVGGVVVERKEGVGKSSSERDGREDGDGDGGTEEESTAFETMRTPFERANEGRAKMRAVPVMSIYLSRVRIDALRKAYGEQTNALPVQKERDELR